MLKKVTYYVLLFVVLVSLFPAASASAQDDGGGVDIVVKGFVSVPLAWVGDSVVMTDMGVLPDINITRGPNGYVLEVVQDHEDGSACFIGMYNLGEVKVEKIVILPETFGTLIGVFKEGGITFLGFYECVLGCLGYDWSPLEVAGRSFDFSRRLFVWVDANGDINIAAFDSRKIYVDEPHVVRVNDVDVKSVSLSPFDLFLLVKGDGWWKVFSLYGDREVAGEGESNGDTVFSLIATRPCLLVRAEPHPYKEEIIYRRVGGTTGVSLALLDEGSGATLWKWEDACMGSGFEIVEN